MLEMCPEARINLAVHYLKQGQLQEAYQLAKDLQPATPQEYTLKGLQYPPCLYPHTLTDNWLVANTKRVQYFQCS